MGFKTFKALNWAFLKRLFEHRLCCIEKTPNPGLNRQQTAIFCQFSRFLLHEFNACVNFRILLLSRAGGGIY